MNIEEIQRLMGRLNSGDFTERYLDDHDGVLELVTESPESLEKAVDDVLSTVASDIAKTLPAQLTRDGVRIERVARMRVVTARGYQMDVVPTLTKITISEDTGYLTAIVEFDDGTYDAVDLKRERERFSIHDSAPTSDLVGMVVRWLRSRIRDYAGY
jgi:hypothetical protein